MMNEFIIVLTGVLLRIAIPALILLGLTSLLNFLDKRWKLEAACQSENLSGVDPIPSIHSSH
jgi:hypothetical protein